jgi:GNAT superfamily N-acetyltransferase
MLSIRRGEASDSDVLAALHADYIRESFPGHRGSTEAELARDVLSGAQGIRVLLVEQDHRAVGFLTWQAIYDSHWAAAGGEIVDVYVVPERRGHGIALALVARMCADVRAAGGEFLRGRAYDRTSATGRFYERIAVGHDSAECNLSAKAFRSLAELAGRPVRELVKALPRKEWNFEA